MLALQKLYKTLVFVPHTHGQVGHLQPVRCFLERSDASQRKVWMEHLDGVVPKNNAWRTGPCRYRGTPAGSEDPFLYHGTAMKKKRQTPWNLFAPHLARQNFAKSECCAVLCFFCHCCMDGHGHTPSIHEAPSAPACDKDSDGLLSKHRESIPSKYNTSIYQYILLESGSRCGHIVFNHIG